MKYSMSIFLVLDVRKVKLETFEFVLNKNRLFWNFQIFPFVPPKPFEVCTHTITHLKALINGFMELEGLRHGSTFTLYHTLEPYPVLHYKLGKGAIFILGNLGNF